MLQSSAEAGFYRRTERLWSSEGKAMNRDRLDKAAWEVVLAHVLFIAFVSYLAAARLHIPDFILAVARPDQVVTVGYALICIGAFLAIMHRPVARNRDRRIWFLSIALAWSGTFVVALGTFALPLHSGTVVRAGFGLILFVGATCVRASHPRGMMLLAIERARNTRAKVDDSKRQQSLAL
jgi:hypothetical protein